MDSDFIFDILKLVMPLIVLFVQFWMNGKLNAVAKSVDGMHTKLVDQAGKDGRKEGAETEAAAQQSRENHASPTPRKGKIATNPKRGV